MLFGAVVAAQTALNQSATARHPKLANAKMQVVSGSAGLEKTVTELVKSQAGPIWMGYAVHVEAKDRTLCCFDSWSKQTAACKLEKEGGNLFNGSVNQSECEDLEPADFAFVMLRSEGGALTKARAFSRDCGGLSARAVQVMSRTAMMPMKVFIEFSFVFQTVPDE